MISALRLTANTAGAFSRSLRSIETSVIAGLVVSIVGGRALLAALPLGAFGEDRLDAAVGKLGLARQRLRLGADLGGHAAMAFDVAADRSETRSRCPRSTAAPAMPASASS